jgi:hypothetical protein
MLTSRKFDGMVFDIKSFDELVYSIRMVFDKAAGRPN